MSIFRGHVVWRCRMAFNRGSPVRKAGAGRPVVGKPVAAGRRAGAAGVWIRCTGERGGWLQGLGEGWGGENPGVGNLEIEKCISKFRL